MHYDTPVFREPYMIGKKIRGFRKIDFKDLLYSSGYGNLDRIDIQRPVFNLDVAKKYIEDNKLVRNSIILSPYAKCMTNVPNEFWCIIVKCLNELGWKVYTNCAGNEKAIEGTEVLRFDFSISVPVTLLCCMIHDL